MPGCRAHAIQIQDLVKSRMPEIVEPKQLIQSRVLVKRARLTVKRGAARPNGKSKPPQSPLRRAVRYQIRGAARHSTQDYQRFFFCCIAERAIKPCRSSRSKLRGEFGIPRHLQNRNQKHKNKATRQTTTQNKTKTRAGKCWNVKREVRKGETSEAAHRTHM